MPQIKSMKSLFEMSVDFVAHNMDVLSKLTSGEDEIYFIPPDVSTPFDKLPSVILEKILNVLQQKDLLKKQHVELLLASQLQILDLKGKQLKFDVDGMLDILYRAYIRCLDIKILKLPNYEKFQDYVSFFPKFEKLQVLVISKTSTSDECLELIGSFCKNLRVLDITDCLCVTDKGIKGLCVSVAEGGATDNKQGQCKLIENLLSRGTRISNKGIRMAIKNMRALKIFTSASVQNLADIHEMDLKNKNLPEIPKYSLTNLQLDTSCKSFKCDTQLFCHYKRGSLEKVVPLYPFLMRVEINITKGFTNEDLKQLKFIEQLCELKISGSCTRRCYGVTFDEGVIPLLTDIGPSLRKLELKELTTIRRIDIRVLTKLCPNLCSLVLYRNSNYINSKPEETPDYFQPTKLQVDDPVLNNLSVLHLNCHEDDTECRLRGYCDPIPEENLVSLLSLPSLIDIQIAMCDSLTDVVLERVGQFNNFSELEVLKVITCNSVSINGIKVFMDNKNPLHTVKLFNCELLTDAVVREFKNFVSEKNWMLTIT